MKNILIILIAVFMAIFFTSNLNAQSSNYNDYRMKFGYYGPHHTAPRYRGIPYYPGQYYNNRFYSPSYRKPRRDPK